MDKNFIEVDGIKITYFEKNGQQDRPTIFFYHGNSVSSRTWRKQLNDPLFDEYRLVAIDLPAHGHSGVANDPHHAYTLPKLANIMAKALHQLTNGMPYVVAGVSLSTNIVAEMLVFETAPRGVILAGPSVVGAGISVQNIIKAGTHVGVVFTDDPDMDDVKSYAEETSLSRDENDLQIFMEDFRGVQKPFRSALGQSIANADYSDEIAILQQKNIPLLIVFGEDEKVVETSYLDEIKFLLWGEKIFKIPGASHLVQIDQPEIFNELIKKFATDLF